MFLPLQGSVYRYLFSWEIIPIEWVQTQHFMSTTLGSVLRSPG